MHCGKNGIPANDRDPASEAMFQYSVTPRLRNAHFPFLAQQQHTMSVGHVNSISQNAQIPKTLTTLSKTHFEVFEPSLAVRLCCAERDGWTGFVRRLGAVH